MPPPQQNDLQNVLQHWWNLSLRAKGVAVLAAPLAALFAVLIAIHSVDGEVQQIELRFDHAQRIRLELMRLRASLEEAERTQAVESMAVLARLVAPDSHAAAEFTEIRRLATVAAGQPAAIADLRQNIGLLDDYEQRNLTAMVYQRELARRRLFRTVILCGIFGPIGALFTHLLITGRLVSRLRAVAENARRLAHGLPLDPAPYGTDEIAALAGEVENAAHLLRERERELRESERRYRDLFDHAPVAYEEADREGIIRHFNQAMCRLLRCTPHQLLARHAWEFVTPEFQDRFRAELIARMANGVEGGTQEIGYVLDDGTHITVEIRENLKRNDQGQVTGIVRSLIDVTERNLAAIAARKVEQYAIELRNANVQLAHALDSACAATVAKSRFLAGVSHELRTPLNGIIGFSELLYDGKLGPVEEGQREVLGDILASSRHLLQLINDILDLSKIEAGRMEFRPERQVLKDLVLEVRDVVRPMAEKKSLEVAVDVQPGIDATLDSARFKQVLYNYLSNAVKFTPERGRVTVRVLRENDDRFRLEVEDSGIGIRDEQLPLLFQEFAQLPNHRRAEQGTGLGLALTVTSWKRRVVASPRAALPVKAASLPQYCH
jgi:PAS domain S-box-containing protein